MPYRSPRLSLALTIPIIWLALARLGTLAYTPPPVRPADAPADEFSAQRALPILQTLAGDGIPHPAGTEQNATVRSRILEFFHQLGYDARVQDSFAVTWGRTTPIPLHNILVRQPGTNPGPAVLLAAHYDSVPTGPGASDDAVAVAAILEIARMMRLRPPARNDVIYLITDGEEIGLLGAKAFARDHPWARDVKAAINLEARGTAGRSLMFQTTFPDAWLIDLYARRVTHPTTSSLYAEVYKRLPNDSDFTVFKDAGIAGYNFAFIGNPRNYHTAQDNYENADPRSLQHHGDNAWRLLTALADLDLENHAAGRAIYTDLFGTYLVWWPMWLNLALAAGSLVLTFWRAGLRKRPESAPHPSHPREGASNPAITESGPPRETRSPCRAALWPTLTAAPKALLLALLVSAAAEWLPPLRSLRRPGWTDHPVPILVLYWLLAASVMLGVLVRAGRQFRNPWSAWSAAWLPWNLISLATAILIPGTSYLFVVPGATAALLSATASLVPARTQPLACALACWTPALAAATLWLPIQTLLYDGVGFTLPIVYSFSSAFMTLSVLPLFLKGQPPTSAAAAPEFR